MDGSEAGILRRVHEYLFGNADLAQIDRERIAHLFPVAFNVLLAEDKKITGKWDLTGIEQVDVGTLTMERGGTGGTDGQGGSGGGGGSAGKGAGGGSSGGTGGQGSQGAYGATGTAYGESAKVSVLPS